MERIALLLEIIGFCLASVSVAALQIDKIKNWADSIKALIHNNFEKISDPELKQIIESHPLAESLVTVGECVILAPIKALGDIFYILIALLKIKYPWKARKKKIELYHKLLKNRSELFSLGFKILAFAIYESLLQNLINGIYFSLRILSRKQAITRFLIVIGTATLLSGLILELIVNW